MAKTYQAIPVISLNAGSHFSHPPTPSDVAHLDDAAINVMNDFNNAHPITIGPDAPIPEAAMEMRVCNTHLLLVIDNDGIVIGLISSEDILGEKPMKITQERRIHRAEILVRMVMTPQAKIAAFDLEELRHAKVGNVIQTLHELNQHYAIVVEVDHLTGKQMVRGLFSLSHISRQVGYDVTFELHEAYTLAELKKDLKE